MVRKPGLILFSLSLAWLFFSCAASPRYHRDAKQKATRTQRAASKTKIIPPARSGSYQVGQASFYGPGFQGKKTASGETFNQNAMTCAHKKLPFNTRLKVTNLDNGQTVVVRVNDRGPFAKNRILDLSAAAGKKIGLEKTGHAKVRLEIIP